MLVDNVALVEEKIKQALAARTEEKITGQKITIVAVTKNHPAEIVTEALNAGLTHIGENRVQEAEHKRAVLPPKGVWHLLGHLQSNKVKLAVDNFDLIESVDSVKILNLINKAAEAKGKQQEVLLQINEANEPQKSGFSPEEFRELLPSLGTYANVRIRGVMVIAQATDQVEETRPVFRAGYEDFLLLQKQPGMQECTILSMGMTHDYWIAVEEGANFIRVGTALFGPRDYSMKY